MKAPAPESGPAPSSWLPKTGSGAASPLISRFSGFETIVYGVLGVVLLLAGWQILSMLFREVIVASPLATLNALASLVTEQKTWEYVLITFERLLIGLFLGSLLGLGLGLAAGMNRRIRSVLEPLRWVSMTVPAVVIAIVAMLWFGMGSAQVIFVVAVIVAPITYVNAMEGRFAIDEKIIEMGRTFKFPRRMFLTEIFLPGIGASVLAGLTLTAGMGVRVVVLAELMGAHDGIGHGLSMAWTHLNTPQLFAWILLALALMGILEFGMLNPMRTRLMRWKTAG
jgi:NitT/TauT family transport system permease protein